MYVYGNTCWMNERTYIHVCIIDDDDDYVGYIHTHYVWDYYDGMTG